MQPLFKFHNNYGLLKSWPIYHYQSADFIPYEIGITYSFPIFITNSNFLSDSCIGKINMMARKSDSLVLKWWRDESQKYSLDDLFLLDKLRLKEPLIPISYSDDDTRSSFGHAHNGL